jgi:hypothetical protein
MSSVIIHTRTEKNIYFVRFVPKVQYRNMFTKLIQSHDKPIFLGIELQ